MPLMSTAAANAALNGLDGTGTTNVISAAALHTATPGTTGASENANAGGYARQALTMAAAASGAKTNSSGLTFSTAGTAAVTHVGAWNSTTFAGGAYAIGAALGAQITAITITVAAGALSFGAS